jgi:hypothetical protein
MFNSKISNLQLYTAPASLTGLVEKNSLYKAFAAKPTEMKAVMAKAFGEGINNVQDTLDMLTTGAMQTEYIETETYRWPLFTKDTRAVEVAGPNIDGGSTPGINLTTFRIPFTEKFFEIGDNLRADDGTMVRVQEDPYQQGNQWIYTVILTSGRPTDYLDQQYCTYGSRFSAEWADYEELSMRGSGVNASTHAMLENQISTFRKTIVVSRHAAQTKQVMDIVYTNPETGKAEKTMVWAAKATWQAYSELKVGVMKAMIYGNKTDHVTGSNGRTVTKGAGFREQISPSNVWEYPGYEMSYDLMKDFVTNLVQTAVDNGGKPNLVCLTGQDGLDMVDRMLRKKFADMGNVYINSDKFVSGTSELKLGGYFRTVEFSNGVTVHFKNFAPQNDRDTFRLKNPFTGNPMEASVFTFMNFGTDKDNTGNIKKIYKKGGEKVMWSVSGSIAPGGVKTSINTQGASGIDGYEVHFLEECGLKVSDPTSCGILYPASYKWI